MVVVGNSILAIKKRMLKHPTGSHPLEQGARMSRMNGYNIFW